MNTDFSGKFILVAGGTGGLGRSVSLSFLHRNATVAVTWRREQEFQALNVAAGDSASRLVGFQVDITDLEAAHTLAQQVLSRFRVLDVLVNTVGGYVGGTPLWQLAPEEFDRMVNLNLRASFNLTKAVVPAMIARQSGSIINVAAKAAWDHAAGASAYAASKAAVVALLDSLSADLLGTGVRANSILPSIIDTAANRTAMPKSDFSKWPKPDDIAEVVLFLASDEARVIHGAAIPVFGAA